jgi:hypothetical protein
LTEFAHRGGAGTSLAATVDENAGTIHFTTTADGPCGRYQVFVEKTTTSVTIYRETFDALGQNAGGIASFPTGWASQPSWLVGTPTAVDASGHVRPVPASAPNLLAIGLRHDYTNFDTSACTSTAFVILPTPGGKKIMLRFQESHDLETSFDYGVVTLVMTSPTLTKSRQQLTRGRTTATTLPSINGANEPILPMAIFSLDMTSAVAAGFTALSNPTFASCQLEFRIDADVSNTLHGWFIDDIEVTQE